MVNKSFNVNLNHKIRPFKKTIKVDSDKSISIRSLLIGAICEDISKVKNILESEYKDIREQYEVPIKQKEKKQKVRKKTIYVNN